MSFSFDFSGKNVFVFGGTSGINLGIAEAFADAGARIGVASRSQEKVDARSHGCRARRRRRGATASTCARRRPSPMRSHRSHVTAARSTS